VRAVVPIRLSDAERGQISAAAKRRGLTLSAFLREAGLQAAVPRQTVEDADPEPAPARGLLVLELDAERAHFVDGELVRRGV
jgi:uncharacterized protein (DUF1778 family)